MPPDPDPLLEFFAEPAAVAPSEYAESVGRGEPAVAPETIEKSAQSAVPPQDPSIPAGASEDDDAYQGLSLRVARTERLLDRALVEITSLKSDLATLVTAVEDIRKRQSRVETSPGLAVAPAARTSHARPILTAVVLAAGVAVGWGVMSLASDEVPEPPPIESRADEPTGSPAPVVGAARPGVDAREDVDLEPPASAAAVAAPAVTTPVRKAQPARDPPARPPETPVTGYVGTLTIDATPDGEVFLNRKSVGRTPLRLQNLRAGSHLIWIEREGYRRWTRVVAVAANRTSHVAATLDSLSR